MTDVPIACTLTSAELQSRGAQLLPGLVAGAIARVPVSNGFRWAFAPRPGLLAAVVLGLLGVDDADLVSQGSPHASHQFFDLGTLRLESGDTLPSAKLLFVTHGQLAPDRRHAVLLPSWYGGNHHGYDFMIGAGRALDPTKQFIVVAEMFGSGGSSSPSNTPDPRHGPRFPSISIRDNV